MDEKTIQNITTTENAFDAIIMIVPSDGSKYNAKLSPPRHPLVSEIGNQLVIDHLTINFEYCLHARTGSHSSSIDLSNIMKKFPKGGGHHAKIGVCIIRSGCSFHTFFQNIRKSGIFISSLNLFEIKKVVYHSQNNACMKILCQDVLKFPISNWNETTFDYFFKK